MSARPRARFVNIPLYIQCISTSSHLTRHSTSTDCSGLFVRSLVRACVRPADDARIHAARIRARFALEVRDAVVVVVVGVTDADGSKQHTMSDARRRWSCGTSHRGVRCARALGAMRWGVFSIGKVDVVGDTKGASCVTDRGVVADGDTGVHQR